MSPRPAGDDEIRLIRAYTARLRAGILAIAFGLTAGSGIAAATLWLVIRNGPQVGLHLGLLRNYFPGYSVTWLGAGVGFLYGLLVGAAAGWSLAWIYNRVASRSAGRNDPAAR